MSAVTIHCKNGSIVVVPEDKIVQRVGLLAVHPAWCGDALTDLDIYTVTHVPTGFAMGDHIRKVLALAQAAAFSAFDLSAIREAADLKAHPHFEQLKLIRATFAAVESEWDSLEVAAIGLGRVA